MTAIEKYVEAMENKDYAGLANLFSPDGIINYYCFFFFFFYFFFFFFFFFFFKQKTAYEISACLVGSENVYKRQT